MTIAGELDPVFDVAPTIRGNVVAGLVAIAIGFGGFLAWGYSVHLDSAAVATGSVIVDTKSKTVNHLEGGILKQLLVKEGDFVRAGQPLLQMDDTKANADLRQLQARRIGYIAKLARLRAEQTGARSIDFPAELIGARDSYRQQIVTNETLLFDRRRDTLERTIGAQRQAIESLNADATAAQAQLDANAQQQQLVSKQIASYQTLFDKGLATRAQLSELQQRLSVLVSQAGAFTGNRARATESKAQAEVEISKTETAWQSDVADAMQQTQIDLSAIEDGIAAAADILKRVVVTSPEDGYVTNLQVRTPGGVISAGQAILDIVPGGGVKSVEARLDPRDIDAVRVGAKVQIRLTAYGSKQLAPIDGVLSYVAADQMVDERTSVAYYVVRATITDVPGTKPNVVLNAGEPADLLIINKPRLAIDYILSPLTDSLRRAFHEE